MQMGWVVRKFECGLGHRWSNVVEKGAPPPDECPICEGIVSQLDPTHAPARARSDNQPAPNIRGQLTKTLQSFEHDAFVRPHFDDGKPMMTNLCDNVQMGESYAVPETPSTNQTMAMTAEMIHYAETEKKQQRGRETEGAHLTAIGGGWQGASPQIIQAAGGPQSFMGRPQVDLQSKRRPA